VTISTTFQDVIHEKDRRDHNGIEPYSWTPRCQGVKKVPEMRQLEVDRMIYSRRMKGVLRHTDKSGDKNAALVNGVSYAVFERLQPFISLSNAQHASILSDLKELLHPE